MNRERLKTLRDHLAGLPDEQFGMEGEGIGPICGTVACVGGWASYLANPERQWGDLFEGADWLELISLQYSPLFWPTGWESGKITRTDAIAAIDSMLANPDDLALPVWPEKAVSA